MKDISSQLKALLESSSHQESAHLITVELLDGGDAYSAGTVLQWADWESDIAATITFNGRTGARSLSGTWHCPSSGAPIVLDSCDLTTVSKAGFDIDELKIDLGFAGGITVQGVYGQLFASRGGFDGARVQLDRIFPSHASYGTVMRFVGNVAEAQPYSTMLELTVKDDKERFQTSIPRHVITPLCTRQFGDAGCGFNVASLRRTGTAATGSTAGQINFATLNPGGGVDFSYGRITFTSGRLTGLSRTIASSAGNAYAIVTVPFPAAPAVGDSFFADIGCNKSLNGCRNTDKKRWRAFPYLPRPENSVGL